MRITGVLAVCLCAAASAFSIPERQDESRLHIAATGKSGDILLTTDDRAELILLRSGGVRRLVRSPGCGTFPAFSPDGSRIGFKSIAPSGLQAPATLDAASGQVTLLHEPCQRCGQVSFADDGTMAFTIAETLFVQDGGTEGVTRAERIARDGGRFRKFPLGVYSNLAPISPDGRYAAFNDDDDQLWLLDFGTGVRRRITDGATAYTGPQWSRDGQYLLFGSLDGQLQVYDLQEERTHRLGEGYSAVWMPDGRSIVYCRRQLSGGNVAASDIFCTTADGAWTAQLTSTPDIREAEPQVTRDGSAVLCEDELGTDLLVSPLLHPGTGRTASLGKAVRIQPPVLTEGDEIASQERRRFPTLQAFTAVQQLDMPYVHQAWDTPDWFNGDAACAPTTAIMTLAYYGVLPAWDLWCTWHQPAHSSQWGRYVCEPYTFMECDYSLVARDPSNRNSWGGYGFMWSNSRSPLSSMHIYYRNHGLLSEHIDAPAHSMVAAEIAAGYPISLCVGLTSAGHLVAAHGLGTEPHTLVVNDPWGNKNLGTYPNYSGKNAPYDWPGYNNGNNNLTQVFWSASSRGTPPAVSDTLVDDMQFRSGFMMNTNAPASMGLWKDRKAGYRNHAWYASTRASEATDTCYAVWTPVLARPGVYEVLAYIPSFSTATKATYLVQSAAGEQKIVVDQAAAAGGWVSLGSYTFIAGGPAHVRLGDATGRAGEILAFDAVRWSYRGSTAVTEGPRGVPDRFSVLGNYPNPFNPTTRIRFVLASASAVRGIITNTLGQVVNEFAAGRREAGVHEVIWSAGPLPSGVYFATVEAVPLGGGKAERRTLTMVLAR